MSKVFFSVGLSLDGFLAPEGIDRRRVKVEVVEALHSPLVAHLRYAVAHAS
jgi:hypothetical protein